MKFLKHIVAPVLATLLLASCESSPVAGQKNLPSVCIITGEEATGGPTDQFMGQTVNFCCDRCKSKWTAMDEAAKKAAVAEFNR
ncbi:MAG: hypothetical protein ACI91B_003510 [Planctomycetota bacterium]|jgi:hypothetical protein